MIQTKFKMYEADKQLKALAAAEDERKAALCDLFYEMEQAERKLGKPSGANKKHDSANNKPVRKFHKYERKYEGVVQVIKKSATSLAIVSGHGEMMGRLIVNEAISSRINLFDDLILKMGFRDGKWRSLCLLGIGSRLSPEIDPNLN